MGTPYKPILTFGYLVLLLEGGRVANGGPSRDRGPSTVMETMRGGGDGCKESHTDVGQCMKAYVFGKYFAFDRM